MDEDLQFDFDALPKLRSKQKHSKQFEFQNAKNREKLKRATYFYLLTLMKRIFRQTNKEIKSEPKSEYDFT